MNFKYREKIHHLFQKFRSSDGAIAPTLRGAVEAQSARWANEQGAEQSAEIPEAWQPYLQKVALHAYKITDADIQQLKEAGYTEDEIFELTIASALGASRARLDLGLSLLHSGEE